MQPFTKTYKKGINLFHENDYSRELFVIQCGSVKVYRRINTKEIELAVLSKGSVVGEMALIDGKPRSASAIALEDSTVTIIDAETFLERVAGAPPWFISVIKTVSEKIRNANRRLEVVYERNHAVACALTLHYMFLRSGATSTLACPETVAYLSRLLCISPQRCTEALENFQKKGLLNTSNNNIRLIDARKFHDYCFFLRAIDRKTFDTIKPLTARSRPALTELRGHVQLGSVYLDKIIDISASDMNAILSKCAQQSDKQAVIAELRDAGVISALKSQPLPAAEAESGPVTYCIDRAAFEKQYLHAVFSSIVEQ